MLKKLDHAKLYTQNKKRLEKLLQHHLPYRFREEAIDILDDLLNTPTKYRR